MTLNSADCLSNLEQPFQSRTPFEQLMRAGAALLSGKTRQEVLQTILQGVAESGFDRVRLFLLSPDRRTLHGVAQLGMTPEQFNDVSWLAAEDYHFKLMLREPRPYLFVETPEHRDRNRERFDKADLPQWAAVPLILRDRVIGHLAVDNKFSRRTIHEAELPPLMLFGMQAAAAIENADLGLRDEKKLKLFAKLAQATTEIVGQIGKHSLHDLLTLVARQANDILAAEVCSVFRCKHEGFLTLEAGDGYVPGSFKQGLEFPIRRGKSGSFASFTGHVASEGRLVNLHGDALREHPAVQAQENAFSPSGQCHSVLLLPLKQLVDGKEKLIGLLRADNKKDENGRAHFSLAFTPEDEWILRIFGEVIVVCLENAKQVERQQLLIQNLPQAVIAIDSKGNVTEFNHQAEEILGYKAAEVLGQKVSQLYNDPAEPKRIGEVLSNSEGGSLSGYFTLIRTKTGWPVPISLSAYCLYDHHQRSGSVGIFEDQRKLQDYQKQLELTLQATRTVAEAGTLQTGLQGLAELLAARFPGTYCGVLLFDETETYLVEQAAVYGQLQLPAFRPSSPRQIVVNEFPGLAELLEAGRPIRLHANSDPLTAENLKKLNEEYGFDPPINSLLVLPIKLGNRVLGALDLAETCAPEQSQFSRRYPENLKLATAIATQSAIFIERIQANDQEESRSKQIRLAAEALAGVTGLDETTDQILDSTRELFNADAVIFGYFDHHKNTLVHRFSKASGISKDIWEPYRDREDDEHITARLLVEKHNPVLLKDVTAPGENDVLDEVTREAMRRIGIKSFLAIPLRVGEERLGLVCALYRNRQRFNKKESRTAASFGRYAALSLKNAKLFKQVKKTSEAATAVTKVTVLGQRQATLNAIVKEVSNVTHCDAVVLFEYDQDKQRLRKASVAGLYGTKHALSHDEERNYPLVHEMLNTDESYRVIQIANHPEYRDLKNNESSFATEQQIATFVAFPLRAADRKVGVLFVNFRTPRTFTSEELETMQLFANQSALAIHYAQSTEANLRKLHELETLKTFSDQLRQTQTLQEMVDCVVTLTAQELEADYCNLILPDQDGKLCLYGQHGWNPPLEKFFLEPGNGSQTGHTILTEQPVYVSDYKTESRFTVHEHILNRGVTSGLSVPLFRGKDIIGALLVFTAKPRQFTEESIHYLGLIANHAALAIHSQKNFDDLRRRDKHLTAAHNSSAAVLKNFGDEQKVLDQVVKEAVESITGINEPKAVYATLQLYDADRNELVIRSVYPPESQSLLDAEVENGRWSLDPQKARRGKIGVTGRTVKAGCSQLVGDLEKDDDYIRYNPTSKSELSVPLKLNGQVIGTINVESDQLNGFDANDQYALEALADHAVIAMEIARTHKDLRQTKGLIGTRTALAWMGMTNNAWRHTVAGDAAEMANRITLIRGYLKQNDIADERISNHLEQIEQLAKSIQEQPVTPPLSSEEGVVLTNLNELVTERVRQLRQTGRYENIGLMVSSHSKTPLIVKVCPDWLRRALDILINNGAKAVRPFITTDPARCEVKVLLGLNGQVAELRVLDRGSGIPEEIQNRLFAGQVESSNGQGVGLLIAQAIVETYSGQIEVSQTGADGTEMLIRLPNSDREE